MKHYIYLLAVLLIVVQGCGKVNSDDPGLLYSVGDTSVQDLGRANGVYYNGVKVVDIKLAYRTHGTVKVGPNKETQAKPSISALTVLPISMELFSIIRRLKTRMLRLGLRYWREQLERSLRKL